MTGTSFLTTSLQSNTRFSAKAQTPRPRKVQESVTCPTKVKQEMQEVSEESGPSCPFKLRWFGLGESWSILGEVNSRSVPSATLEPLKPLKLEWLELFE